MTENQQEPSFVKISSTKTWVRKMARRGRSNKTPKKTSLKGIDLEYFEEAYGTGSQPTPAKRSRSSPNSLKPSAATTRSGRTTNAGGDAGKWVKGVFRGLKVST